MGQRFQVFLMPLIALMPSALSDPSYRYMCVGAIHHHQWCYHTMPLEALHRFFDLLRESENAALCTICEASCGAWRTKVDRSPSQEPSSTGSWKKYWELVTQ
ncbi:hypothetical protein C8Q70DRAFT_930099 [Cubamyces menziesii]|nr:hypothetical protein C8Q70DRAFT_930099 [Cubamyces menziesii]